MGLPKKTFEMIGDVVVKSEHEKLFSLGENKKLKLNSDSEAVPKRSFIQLPESAEVSCLGTVWFECPSSGHVSSSFCTHCLNTLIQIKTMVCDLWDGLNEEFLQELLVKESQLIDSIHWRDVDDLKSAILAVKSWNPMCGMNYILESDDDGQLLTDEISNTGGDTLMTEDSFYDTPRDTCPLCQQDAYDVKVWDGKRVCTSCHKIYQKSSISATDYVTSYVPRTISERFKPLPNFVELQLNPGPRLFVCTLSRRSNNGIPPKNSHQYVWDMLERKNGLPGRWNGSSVVTGDQRGTAIPGRGSVVWAFKAHFRSAVYGSILKAQTSGSYIKPSLIDTYAKQLMTHEDDCFLVACSTPENFLCNPNHIMDFLIRFEEIRNLGSVRSNSKLQQPRAIPLEKLFFAFQGLDINQNFRANEKMKMEKYFTVFSGAELREAIQNRIALTGLRPVVRFLFSCRGLLQKRAVGVWGQGRNKEQLEDSQPTASQELLDWTVDERDFVHLD